MKSLILRRVPMKMIRIGTLFLAGTFALTGTSVLRADTKTLEGTVSDTKCMAQHSMKDCYELVVGSAVYTLKASAKDNMEIEKLAGKTAKITGDLTGDTVMVNSVAAGTAPKK